jgi:DNA polymerase-3 subunit gamma/tau
MDKFVVSARKYRPKGFEEVVGQEHITTTLTNAIQNNHLAQAFLFCGPRGVGKTTCARIVARMINGFDEATADQLIGGAPTHMNIYELDAASNNSVDDIRALVEQVRFPPQYGKYKVYIIDEVHMLSNQAFNAFLKTLEEPPSYAIFILATTEKHKVIPTILSRCQIFDFKRIQISDIVHHLAKVAEMEGIKAEPEALNFIAQKADGAMRDALSLFDLIATFSSDNAITYKKTIETLHILDHEYYFKAVDHILAEDSAALLLLFDEILQFGFDAHLFVVGFAEHLRNLLVSKESATAKLLPVTGSLQARYHQQGKVIDTAMLVSGMNLLMQCDIQYKTSKSQRLLVELTLIKLAYMKQALTFGEAERKRSLALKNPTGIRIKEEIAPQTVAAIATARKSATPTTTPKVPKLTELHEKVLQYDVQTGKKDNGQGALLTKNLLDTIWQELAAQAKENGKVQEHYFFAQTTPLLEHENLVWIELEGDLEIQTLGRVADTIRALIAQKGYQVPAAIKSRKRESQRVEDPKIPYSAKERLAALAEKYPAIAELKVRLGLELD